MKHVTQGLSLIEISIALFISSLLMLSLYQAFNNAQRTSQAISATLIAETDFSSAYHQLEKDIATIFVPEQVFIELAKKSSEKNETEKQQKEGLKDIFIATHKEKNMDMLSFFSTSCLPRYNTATPYAVRIVYRLVQQENELYKLTRQNLLSLKCRLKKLQNQCVHMT